MRALLLVVGLSALVAAAQGIVLDTSRRLALTDCPMHGGDGGAAHAGSLVEGQYLFRTTGEDVSVCFHTYAAAYPTGCTDGGTCWSCPSGGEIFPQGTVLQWSVPRGGQAFSCRSAADAGDVTWTRAH